MKTAVDWLVDHLYWVIPDSERNFLEGLRKEALVKEKEQIGQFMNWFIKHYSTATIDGMFGWVNSMDEEVTLKEILDDYYNYYK